MPQSAGPVTLAATSRSDSNNQDPALLDAKIMMIDDEPTTLDVLQALLEDAGYQYFITTCQSEQAMDIIIKDNPDVVLTDLHMPLVNGFDIVQAMRADMRLQHLPVIMLTSDDNAKTKLQALQLGATDFLAKPVDPSELTLRLRNTLEAKAHQDRLANYDPTTGLPNRRMLISHLDRALQRAVRETKTGAVLHISLDRFKQVNETLGYSAGDVLLKTIAQRLESVLQTRLRHQDQSAAKPLLSRMRGDEFIVLLPETHGPMHVDQLARHFLEALREPFHVDHHDLTVSAGIGIAMFPTDGADIETLLKHVDITTNHTKQNGSNTHAFYSQDMDAKALQRFSLESQLRKALERDELRLYYQPQVELKTGRIVGAEALLHWQHPELGILPPEQFMPLAEDIGFIANLGEWAIQAACQQAKTWQASGYVLNMGLNVSSQQLHDNNFKRILYRALAKTRLAPQHLTLEFTESMIVQKASEHVSALHEMKEMGVRIAIDHFGKGYSSLIYLDQFPLDELKIDRAFLEAVKAGNNDAPIITAIIAMAHSLGLTAVVEGVETDRQFTFLRDRGCDAYQGRRFSPPVPEADFAALLKRTS
ncbi:MAG: hypothetical protein ETSY1_39360 [Candidatus Entotheonella factor]|uniref:Diguanylate cyclase n=1 Tax=Entotheonella factor TaxID=1429438 RepID=W4L5Q0_ENTF1|nr:EAL domain-containing response regulator [Candidatus Entotheonella palauensis]ETW93413.1 MAG: hypothetical protein ETSY1_39360 [Candidatus Entotheonella factor]